MDAQPYRLDTPPHIARTGVDARTRHVVVVACAASAGLHAALVPAHTGAAAALFGVSAALLVALALGVERRSGRVAVTTAALVLVALLVLYGASRVVAIWPLHHAEPVDPIGVVTKLFEAVGLLASLRLLQVPRAAAKELLAPQEGVDP